MAYRFSASHLRDMFELASFAVPEDQLVFVGLRGTMPADVSGTAFADAHDLNDLGVDYRHMRCCVIQWDTGSDTFAAFPGSTVPNINAVTKGIAKDGQGVNQLVSSFLTQAPGTDRRYYKGDHGLGSSLGPHRGFRNDNKLPIWRTANDAQYEGDDDLQFYAAHDNIHCARQANVSLPSFSSNGCQVIAGVAGVSISKGQEKEQGPWLRFIRNAYSRSQHRFCYALFEFGEAQRTAHIGAESRSPTVRFGSNGARVKALQEGLISHGYDLGPSGADGDFGFATLSALGDFQIKTFGKGSVDLIAGKLTAERLGIAWPSAPADKPDGAEPSVPHISAAASGTYNDKYKVTFDSLSPGGFYSADPDDTSVKRSIRTNNPGALNITGWQKTRPGYVGFTGADSAGNKTTIYRTPEHGIAAWLYLLTDRYGYGSQGSFRVAELARRYAGVESEDSPAAKTYIAGWRKFSGNKLDGQTTISIGLNGDLELLATSMFGHEIGAKSPLSAAQIRFAIELAKSGQLPG